MAQAAGRRLSFPGLVLRWDRLADLSVLLAAYAVAGVVMLFVAELVESGRVADVVMGVSLLSLEYAGHAVFLLCCGRFLDERSSLGRYLALAFLVQVVGVAARYGAPALPLPGWAPELGSILLFGVLIGAVLRPGVLRALAIWALFMGLVLGFNALLGLVRDGLLGGLGMAG